MYVNDKYPIAVLSECFFLKCYYDNITFVPFIFIEDPMDIEGQRTYIFDTQSNSNAAQGRGTGVGTGGTAGSTIVGKQRIDPYFLISQVSRIFP